MSHSFPDYDGYAYPSYANPLGKQLSENDLFTAPEADDTTLDMDELKEIYEKSKPLVLQTEALANKIFPSDGKPIVQGGIIRTNYGESMIFSFFHQLVYYLLCCLL